MAMEAKQHIKDRKGPHSLAPEPITEMATRLLSRVASELSDTCGLADEPLTEVQLFRKLAVLDSLKQINGFIEKALVKIRAPLEEQALGRFETLGINNFNIDGRTVYLHREWWAKSKDPEKVWVTIEALKACEETAPFVKETFNTQTVSAYFRERRIALEEATDELEQRRAEGEETPEDFILGLPKLFPTPALEATIDFSEKTSVRSRAGSGK